LESRSPTPRADSRPAPSPRTRARVLGAIPARYASSRLDGKPLVRLGAKPLIQHVYERCLRAETLDEVVVATDDERIARAVREFGGRVALTGPSHRTGTDRLAEVASGVECDVVVNVQCDSPLFPPAAIDLAVRALLDDPAVRMSTVAAPSTDEAEIASPNSVKVVLDRHGDALYFSRSRIPAPTDADRDVLLHLGIYVYRKAYLLELAAREQTPLESREHLEQLRALEHGDRIRVVRIEECPPGLHDREDLENIRRRLAGGRDG
jgi:3-deoxy-manno-octulosonate cytidylyltransferase (CMP-KDO synthetase)